MAWPTNPTNDQQVTINNVLYQYNAALGVWNKVQLTSPTFLANGSTVTVANNLTAPGNIVAATVSTTGNITGNFILGNGSQLSGIAATYGNANVASFLTTYTGDLTAATVSTTGNVTGSYLFGNGSQLTGISASVTGNVSSANVTYLAPYTSSVTRTGQSKYSDIVCVKDFGAVGNTTTDDTAAIQAAINTGKSVYVPAGTYRLTNAITFNTTGQLIYGDGRSKTTFYIDNIAYSFNLSATGVFVFASGEPGPTLRDLGIQFEQPDTSVRGNLIAYPPAIYAYAQPRFTIQNCKIVRAMTGIDMRGNSGGATVDGLEMSAFNYGVRIDGSLDTVRLQRMQYWPFGLSSNLTNIFFDAGNMGVESGRCDDLKITSCLFINGGIQVKLIESVIVSGTTFGCINDTDFDSFASINMAGGNMSISNCYFTIGDGSYTPIYQTGGYLRVSQCQFESAVTTSASTIYFSGPNGTSWLQLTNNLFRNSGPGAGYISVTSGDILCTNNAFDVGPNQTWSTALVAVSGNGRIIFNANRARDKGTGTGTLLSLTENQNHTVTSNQFMGWKLTLPVTTTNIINANNGSLG